MVKRPNLEQAQRAAIAALLCIAFAIAILDGLSSRNLSTQSSIAAKAGNPTHEQKQEEGWWNRASDPLAVITFLLVVVGGAQLGLFWRQLILIRESLAPAQQAAQAAQDAANAAKTQAEALMAAEGAHLFVVIVNENIESTFHSARMLRIPTKSAGDSERRRPPVPIEAGRGFR
jgi:hypothetical protein